MSTSNNNNNTMSSISNDDGSSIASGSSSSSSSFRRKRSRRTARPSSSRKAAGTAVAAGTAAAGKSMVSSNSIAGKAADLATTIGRSARDNVYAAHNAVTSNERFQKIAAHRGRWYFAIFLALVFIASSVWSLIVLNKPANRVPSNRGLRIIQIVTLVFSVLLLIVSIYFVANRRDTKMGATDDVTGSYYY